MSFNAVTDLIGAWVEIDLTTDVGPNGLDLDMSGELSYSGGYATSPSVGNLFLLGSSLVEADESEPFMWGVEHFAIDAVAISSPVFSLSSNDNPYNIYFENSVPTNNKYNFGRQYDNGGEEPTATVTAPPIGQNNVLLAFYDPLTRLLYLKMNNGTEATQDTSGLTYNNGSVDLYMQANADGKFKRPRFWKGPNARTLYNDPDFSTWYYNSGAGRTYAEILATAQEEFFAGAAASPLAVMSNAERKQRYLKARSR